ncbi:MAG TPA: lysylphosphatidylglycerol synthase transmembrane domain-containing protein [Gaiellaceae bacterium]|nr:lysylphosphatidylglycerol synthase transmembrane domain-containing protein [Gaiellaceae bacterium]
MRIALTQSRSLRLALILVAAVGLGALVWWRGPEWNLVGDAFAAVRWEWVVLAIALNLASVLVRAIAWKLVIDQAIPEPHPGFPLVFSAFSVGLFANAVLPGRIGELARVAVLTRKLPGREGTWASLLGTVFTHRLFDLVPSLLLVIYVLLTANVPHWAYTSLMIALGLGFALLTFGIASARRYNTSVLDELGPVRRLVTMARYGLGILHSPLPALGAAFCQCLGWLCQLLAVYSAMRAFNIHAPLPAAALVLVLMNIATLFPLWPGNIGLVQAAVALPLISYGIAKARGIAYGFGLQAIEASVGVGVGMIFLAREGLSFAMLRVMPGAEAAEVPEHERQTEEARERARVPG